LFLIADQKEALLQQLPGIRPPQWLKLQHQAFPRGFVDIQRNSTITKKQKDLFGSLPSDLHELSTGWDGNYI